MKKILVFVFLVISLTVFSQNKEEAYNEAHQLNLNDKFSDAVSILDKLIEQDTTDYNLFSERGWSYLNMLEFDKAVVELKHALELNSSCIECHFRLARIYYEKGEFDAATKIVNKGFALSDTTAFLYVVRGMIHQAKEENEEALIDYTQAINLDSKCDVCLVARAEYYIRNDEQLLAFNDLGAASEIDPNNDEYYYYRAYLLNDAGIYDDAMIEIEKALAVDNAVTQYHIMKFNIYVNKGEYGYAERCMMDALEIIPGDYLIYSNLADLYSEVNLYDDYCICIQKASQYCPEDLVEDAKSFKLGYSKFCDGKSVGYYFIRALGYYLDGKYDQCIEISKKGIFVLRISPVLFNMRAYAYLAKNEYALAENDFLACLENKQLLESEVVEYFNAPLNLNDSKVLADSYVIKSNVSLAVIELHKNQYDKAMDYVNKGFNMSQAIPDFDDMEILYNIKGLIYIGKNDLVAAENEFVLALNENEEYSPTYLNYVLLNLLKNSTYSSKKFKFEYTGKTRSMRLILSSLKPQKIVDKNLLTEALEICESVIIMEPENPMSYLLKAKIQQYLKEDYCDAAKKAESFGIPNAFKELGVKCPSGK